MPHLFWLSDESWSVIESLLPNNQPGARRVDDRRVISGILYVLRSGCPWRNCPAEYGPSTTVYNRFNRWSRRGVWQRIYEALAAEARIGGTVAIDSTYVKAHRSAAGAKKRRERSGDWHIPGRPEHEDPRRRERRQMSVGGRPIGLLLGPGQQADIRAADDLVAKIGPFDRLIADRAYDADSFRQKLDDVGVKPVIPGRSNRKKAIRHDRRRYKQRWRVDATIGRLKDFRRVATRYDKLARIFLDTVALAAIYMFWM